MRYVYYKWSSLPITFYGCETQSVYVQDENCIFQVRVALVLHPTCVIPYCFNTPCQCVHFLSLYLLIFILIPFGRVCSVMLTPAYSNIFSLMPFGWVCCIMLTPAYSNISYGNIFLIYTSLIYANFFRNTTRAWNKDLVYFLMPVAGYVVSFDEIWFCHLD